MKNWGQWQFVKDLEVLVERGRITFPRQVARELSGQRHTDLPEASEIVMWPSAAFEGEVWRHCNPGYDPLSEYPGWDSNPHAP